MILGNRDKNRIRENCRITDYLGVTNKGSLLVEHPFRSDERPSFSVFTGRDGNQLWKDLATGESGDIIQLHMHVTGCSFGEACHYLGMVWDTTLPVRPSQIATRKDSGKKSFTLNDIKANAAELIKQESRIALNHRHCATPVSESRYLKDIGLSMPDWISEQLEAYTDQRRNLAYKMENGSLHIRGSKTREGRRYAENLGEVSFSVFGNIDAGKWVVTEGLGDVLALLEQEIVPENIAYIILNSTSTTNSTIDFLEKRHVQEILLYLDNDKPKNDGSRTSGDIATSKFLTSFPHIAKDMRNRYPNHKDPLELLHAERSGESATSDHRNGTYHSSKANADK